MDDGAKETGNAKAKKDTHPVRSYTCRRCNAVFEARQPRRLCDVCHKLKRQSDWRKYAKRKYREQKRLNKEIARFMKEAQNEAAEAARAKAKAQIAAEKAERKSAAAEMRLRELEAREAERKRRMADVRRCKFCGKPAYGEDFCAYCRREGFDNVYMVTGRSNGWERREAALARPKRKRMFLG